MVSIAWREKLLLPETIDQPVKFAFTYLKLINENFSFMTSKIFPRIVSSCLKGSWNTDNLECLNSKVIVSRAELLELLESLLELINKN